MLTAFVVNHHVPTRIPAFSSVLQTTAATAPAVSFGASTAIAASPHDFIVAGPPDPVTLLSTLLLVTLSDMVPFVPCQPLAIALGTKLGPWAFPICVLGQTMAGVFAFWGARTAADSRQVQSVLDSLGSDAKSKFEQFRQVGSGSGNNNTRVLLALIGLRLAPFFPFSAGNYLLGGATSVKLRPFIIATIFGCLLSNFLSVGVGIGGAELFFNH